MYVENKLLFVTDCLGISVANVRSYRAQASVQLNTTTLDVLKRVPGVNNSFTVYWFQIFHVFFFTLAICTLKTNFYL